MIIMNLNVLHILEQIWCISVKVKIELSYFIFSWRLRMESENNLL